MNGGNNNPVYKQKLEINKKIDRLEDRIEDLNKKLQSRDFMQKAPKEVIEDTNNKVSQYEDDIIQLKDNLKECNE